MSKAFSLLAAFLLFASFASAYSITSFNDSATSKTFNFTQAGWNSSLYIEIPANANITSATFSLTGTKYPAWTNMTAGGASSSVDIQVLSSTSAYTVTEATGGGGGCGEYCQTFYDWNGTQWDVLSDQRGRTFDLLNSAFGFMTYSATSPTIYEFDGTSWAEAYAPAGVRFYNVDVYSSSLAFASGYRVAVKPEIHKWNGSDWSNETMPLGGGVIAYDVQIVNSSLAFAVLDNGAILNWNGTGWSNETVFNEIADDNLYAIDSYGNDLAFAVGDNGIILKWNGSAWDNSTTMPMYEPGSALNDVFITSATKAFAVGSDSLSNAAIIEWNGTHWYNVTAPEGVAQLNAVSSVKGESSPTTVMAIGANLDIYRYWGYPNKVSLETCEDAGVKIWNQTGTELRSQTANVTTPVDACLGGAGGTLPMNLSVGSPGSITISPNITYGTQLTGVLAGLSFNLSSGASASTAPVYNNSDVYVWNGTTVVAKIPMNFSLQPNYSGWSAEQGANATDGRAYVLAANLSAAGNPMNTSQKTLYVKYSNTSAAKVCVIDNASITSAELAAIANQSQCSARTDATVLVANTTTIGGSTYFTVPNTVNSGAVQIIGSGNNPPVLGSAGVSPSSGNQYSYFAFSVTVTDADNDTMSSVVVAIDGTNYAMTETDPADTNTNDGKAYSYTTLLSGGTTHSYLFSANDGTDNGYTGSSDLYVSYSTTGGVTVTGAPGFDFALAAMLFVAALTVVAFRKQ